MPCTPGPIDGARAISSVFFFLVLVICIRCEWPTTRSSEPALASLGLLISAIVGPGMILEKKKYWYEKQAPARGTSKSAGSLFKATREIKKVSLRNLKCEAALRLSCFSIEVGGSWEVAAVYGFQFQAPCSFFWRGGKPLVVIALVCRGTLATSGWINEQNSTLVHLLSTEFRLICE